MRPLLALSYVFNMFFLLIVVSIDNFQHPTLKIKEKRSHWKLFVIMVIFNRIDDDMQITGTIFHENL